MAKEARKGLSLPMLQPKHVAPTANATARDRHFKKVSRVSDLLTYERQKGARYGTPDGGRK